MKYVQLGKYLAISRIGLGCEQLGGTDWGTFDPEAAKQAVRHAVRSGVTVFDTADVYGLGRSEEVLSEALGDERNSVIIISKCGIRWDATSSPGRAKTYRDGRSGYIRQAVENSLRRLRLESIPVYMVHWPDPSVPIAETIEALEQCRQAGKINYVGVSNFSAEQLRQARAIAPIAFTEMPYNLLDRHAEQELLAICQQLEVAVVTYGPLAQGLLTGKYGPADRFDSNDRRDRLAHFQPGALERNLQTVRRLQDVAERTGRSAVQIAISWVLAHPAVSCVLVGAKTSAQVEENLAALDCSLHNGERAYLSGDDQ